MDPPYLGTSGDTTSCWGFSVMGAVGAVGADGAAGVVGVVGVVGFVAAGEQAAITRDSTIKPLTTSHQILLLICLPPI